MLHQFSHNISHIGLPAKFTYPFHYTPHPLCIIAAEEVHNYILSQEQWKEELEQGKMFGVLVVQTANGEIQYLAAFSGNLAHNNIHPYFVPPVYDLLQPQGFFRIEEENISAINQRIKAIEGETSFIAFKNCLNGDQLTFEQEIKQAKDDLKTAKKKRDTLRKLNLSEEDLNALERESQHQKADFKRLEKSWSTRLNELKSKIIIFEEQILDLKKERKTRSAALQQRLFDQFQMLNYKGEPKGLCAIFEQTAQNTPPAGAGECAAPKLLQYAFLNHLKPIAIAEFWWGNSPKTEIRRHGHYYPACKGKCEPILQHMLQGLEVDDNPLLTHHHRDTEIETIYEDEWLLVVNKPAGMLSVPGKLDVDSVYQRISAKYPTATGPMIVHRLDMATSGLLLIAKDKDVHKALQAQFKNRTIKKRYIALLNGIVKEDEGTINLPLCLNPHDRPRQMVSNEYGKLAITRFEVIQRTDECTRIAFYPLTGRTHQLRVHAAHHLGLNAPIVGDELYGKKADRLCLHAESLEFVHPITNERICLRKGEEF